MPLGCPGSQSHARLQVHSRALPRPATLWILLQAILDPLPVRGLLCPPVYEKSDHHLEADRVRLEVDYRSNRFLQPEDSLVKLAVEVNPCGGDSHASPLPRRTAVTGMQRDHVSELAASRRLLEPVVEQHREEPFGRDPPLAEGPELVQSLHLVAHLLPQTRADLDHGHPFETRRKQRKHAGSLPHP